MNKSWKHHKADYTQTRDDDIWDVDIHAATPLSNVKAINLDQIVADEQTRKHFDETQLQHLADNIKEHGQLQPCRVRYLTERDAYQLIAGERRYRACQLAGLRTLDCIITEVDDDTALVENILENLQRQDLQPLEQARGFQQLMDAKGWSGAQLARNIQVDKSTVSRALKLLALPDDIQQQLEDGQLTPSEALRKALPSSSPSPKRRRITREEKIATPKGTVTVKGRRLMTDDVLLEALAAATAIVQERQQLEHSVSDAA